MRYADYKKYDMVNGQGIRHSLFVSGCTHGCKGCFNKKAWDFNYGRVVTPEFICNMIADLKDDKVSGLSVLGGEPFQSGLLAHVIDRVKLCVPDKDIWVWTGYTFEELMYCMDNGDVGTWSIMHNIDVLVDGKFEEDKKDLTLRFRGSSNQRIIDVKKSLENGEVVLWEQ